MKVLFVKYSVQRKPIFQIMTTIEIDDHGKIWVKKEPATAEAAAHARKIYENAVCISKAQNVFSVPSCSLKDDVLYSSYAEGSSWEKLLAALFEQGDFNGFEQKLKDYRDTLLRLPQIDENPSLYPEFYQYFGGGVRSFRCILLGQADLILENLIIDPEGTLWNIDTEWLIDAPIPIDFLLFRAVSVFYNKYHDRLSLRYSVKDLFRLLEVDDTNLKQFADWECHFSEFIHGESTYEYHQKYIVPTTPVDHLTDKIPNILTSTLFYGMDCIFNEENSMKTQIRSDRAIHVTFHFPGQQTLREIRWDPCEGISSRMTNCRITGYLGSETAFTIQEFRTNAIKTAEGFVFLTGDPQIHVSLTENMTVDAICISSDLSFGTYQDVLQNIFPAVHRQIERTNEETTISRHQKDREIESLRETVQQDEEIIRRKDKDLAVSISQYQNLSAKHHSLAADFNSLDEKCKLLLEEKQSLEAQNTRLSNQIAVVSEHAVASIFEKSNQLDSLLKSRSWKITVPLRAVGRSLRRIRNPLSARNRLPFTSLSFLSECAPGLYQATGQDPQFLSDINYRAGFYFLSWDGMADRNIWLRLYPDFGEGFSENESICIGFLREKRGHHERFIWFPRPVKQIRIDPGEETDTKISISDFHYVRLGKLAALRVGSALEVNRTKASKLNMFLNLIKLTVTGQSGEAEAIIKNVMDTHGDGATQAILKDPYRFYIRTSEPDLGDLHRQREKAVQFPIRPIISIIVPIYNTDKTMLTEMIESVMNQTYDRWELCLADGNSTKPHVAEVLKRFSKKDRRIKIDHLSENLGIAGNTNAALKMATGDYIALLDHDDLLAEWALYAIVDAINVNKEPDVLYSDEDKITFDGSERFFPHFKPDWCPDLLCSYNYITHLFVARRSLVEDAGNFLPGYDGSQDHDLILRTTELANGIVHIPQILYHWRSHSESTAQSQGNKSYTLNAGVRAISSHLERQGLGGTVTYNQQLGFYKVRYDLTSTPLVSIIIPNYEHVDDLRRCIESIYQKSAYKNFEVIIIENNSESREIFAYYEEISARYNVRVIVWSDIFNYSAINNFAASHAKGEILLFLNNDTEVIANDWIEAMLEYAQRQDVGAVGARLLYPDDTVQHAGVILGFLGVAGHSFSRIPKDAPGYMARAIVVQDVSAVTAACLMIRKDFFDRIGGFDESFRVAFNDIDLCMRVRQENKLIVYTPYAELYHHESISRGTEDTEEKQARFSSEIKRFKQKWGEELRRGDPYYNPHLDLKGTPFQISGM